MKNSNFDDLGLDLDSYPKPKRSKPPKTGDLGRLHALLKRGLPEYVHDDVLDVRKLSSHVGVSYQAMYKWFEREQISSRRVGAIVHLSNKTKNRPLDFEPLVHDDFWEFMGTRA